MIALIAVVLLISIAAGCWRVWRGPSLADRLLAVQIFGTAGIAVVLLLSRWFAKPVLLEVALVLALLAAVVSMALVQLLRLSRGGRR